MPHFEGRRKDQRAVPHRHGGKILFSGPGRRIKGKIGQPRSFHRKEGKTVDPGGAGENPGAREARLAFSVLDSAKGRTLVRIKLETGRRHQIRVQFAHFGHPVAGDLRYGAPSPLPQKQIALFAKELIVDHPVRGEKMKFESPLPCGWPWPIFEDKPVSRGTGKGSGEIRARDRGACSREQGALKPASGSRKQEKILAPRSCGGSVILCHGYGCFDSVVV